MIITQPDPWADLSLWMQRRQMVAYCLKFNMTEMMVTRIEPWEC